MPGLVPGIHVFFHEQTTDKTWMAGINPAMTEIVHPFSFPESQPSTPFPAAAPVAKQACRR